MKSILPIGRSGKSAEEVAVAAAGLAGREIVAGFKKFKHLRYKGRRDIVTDTDIAAEKTIIDAIRREFPDHGFLGEESGAQGESFDYQWVIDPLDGTTNYSQTIPVFCTSIALAHRNEVILGVIYEPLRRELFIAVRGQGATLNRRTIQVSTNVDINNAVVGFDLGYDEAGREKAMKQALTLLPIVKTLRIIGSAALALAYTASGRFDLFFHSWLYPWDLAAGALLVSEAGGTITDWERQPVILETRGLIASNRALHESLLGILR